MVPITDKELNAAGMAYAGKEISTVGPEPAKPEKTQAEELPEVPAPVVTPPDAGAKRSLVRKLAEVMAEIGWVEKRGKNTFFNYAYATESDILAVLRPSLGKRGIFIQTLIDKEVTTDTGRTEGAKNDKVYQTNIWTRHIFHDGESGETMTINGMGRGEDRADKGIYKALTGAMKYAMSKAFLVSSGDDPEKEEADEEQQPGQNSNKPAGGVRRASDSKAEAGTTQEFDAQITEVSEKSGGAGKNAWTKFGIQVGDGRWLSTFDPKIATFARRMAGSSPCRFKVQQDGRYLNVVSIVEIPPAGAEGQE